MSDSALRLYLFLHDHARANPSFKMILPVLADHARIPLADVQKAQAELEFAELVEREKTRIVRVGDVACSLRFTAEKDKQAETLLAENAQLRQRIKELEDGDASGLADVLSAGHASVIHAAETVVGRALSYEEVWYLGMITAEFKSARVRNVIYSQRDAKAPLRATFSILRNGAKGKPFEPKIEEPFTYPKAKKGDDPWSRDKA